MLVITGKLCIKNTDLIACAESPPEMIARASSKMQHMALHWHSGSRVTGSALGPPKCCWGPTAFCWGPDGQWRCCANITIDAQAPDSNGVPATIEHLAPPTPVKVVGAWQAIDGNMGEQVAALKEKASSLGEMIRKGHLPQHRNLARQLLWAVIWPSLQRCLPVTTISLEESDEITNGLHKLFLPLSGTN